MLQREQLMRGKEHYRIYSNKRRGAHLIFPATSGWRVVQYTRTDTTRIMAYSF